MRAHKTVNRQIVLGLVLLSVSLILTGCSIPTPSSHSQSTTVEPEKIQAHQQRLHSIFRWQLSARLALFQKQTDERDGLYLDWRWQLENQQQQLRFSHPLKGVIASLSINRQQATLNYDQQEYQAASAEQLLYRLLRAPIPVTAMSQWVVGKYTPSLRRIQYLADGRLGQAQYTDAQGTVWQLNWFYAEDTDNHSLLPVQLHLDSAQVRIKLQMNEWQLEPELQAEASQ